ncbi:CpaD family pilus assembly protein [Sphingomicrobium astaxanthinifaciens]|uniref:CpaD family pilus assembly protein n=1 Tax=Sphingomicrobium astaxanthinifaciens TaxID=1227949 RepID=UPI001FCAB030|nr:CpaD family pilus assembly lipoprotein [Sphingomicrobium astaxanthinifaciens]MCJ7422068.1 CpaD family pilus assembly protein [Sphingomicrobium astaxanthinifaciens]
MMHKLLLAAVALTGLSGCQTAIYEGRDDAAGLGAVNVPVVAQTNYAFDVSAPAGTLPGTEQARLAAWFDSLGLQYGDVVYVDGPAAASARADVAALAGRYGLLLAEGAPVTSGAVPAGAVRVIVGRATASVPGCPNWTRADQPNLQNLANANFGCGVNGALAAMIANPNDLVYGRAGSGVADSRTAARAIQSYRDAAPTGDKGLDDVTTTEN